VNVPVSNDQRDELEPAAVGTQPPPADLERIQQDLADVETALGRLDDGTYFLDEVTGEPMSDEVLAANPLARRVG
jgi:RNA polymerase-binding transcription factor DksA